MKERIVRFLLKQYRWSKLGTSALQVSSSEPTMNLQPDGINNTNKLRRKVLHEFGHAIGLQHEHRRPGFNLLKDPIVKWYEEKEGLTKEDATEKAENQILNQVDKNFNTMLTAYDPASIMHYPIPKAWVDSSQHSSCPLPDASNPDCVPWNTNLSNLDKQGVAEFYPYKVSNSWATRVDFPESRIDERWDVGEVIVDLGYGSGVWYVVMTDDTSFLNQTWIAGGNFSEIEEKIKEN